MFAIALDGVWRDIEGALAELPAERCEGPGEGADELSRRRRARKAV